MQFFPVTTLPIRLSRRGTEVLPGVLVTAAIAVACTGIGALLPVVGSAVPAIVIGVLLSLSRRRVMAGHARRDARLQPGITYSGTFLLQLAVVLLGAQLSLGSIADVGVQSLPIMLTTLTACLLGAWLFGRMLKTERRLTTLIGVGTGICGASAIAAISPVIAATSAEIAYAVSTIFVFNILAVLVFPLLGHLFQLDPHTFRLFAGTAVNDTSSVVAAASVFAAGSLGFAVVVKLVRTLMIIPISIGLSVMQARRSTDGAPLSFGRIVKLIPWFLVGFLIVAAVNSTGILPDAARAALVQASVFLITMALAGIGLSTDIPALRRAGLRPLLLGGLLWVTVTVTALTTIGVTAALRG